MPTKRDYLTSPDAEFTSEKANLAMIGYSDVTSCSLPYEHILHKFFSERISQLPGLEYETTCKRFPGEESAHPYRFLSNLIIEAIDANVYIHRFKESFSAVVYLSGKYDIVLTSPGIEYYIEGPPDEIWTVSSWSLDAATECESPYDSELSKFEQDMHQLLNGFKSSLSLSKSEKLYQMAERVASQIEEKKEEDIDSWADNLSDDLSKLID